MVFTRQLVDEQAEVRILRPGFEGWTAHIYAIGRDGSWAWAYTKHMSTLRLWPHEAELVSELAA